ncbi:MAG: hypothetical protein OSA89_01015 [Mariniblastus sp.]|nr:hypothetical protein [Mariniblastus sp.]
MLSESLYIAYQPPYIILPLRRQVWRHFFSQESTRFHLDGLDFDFSGGHAKTRPFC